jgi:hypothetical protein
MFLGFQIEASCAGLTCASIGMDFLREVMGCRVKPGNDEDEVTRPA